MLCGSRDPFLLSILFLCLKYHPSDPSKKLGLRWLLVLILPVALSAHFFTCCQSAFVCVCVCVFWISSFFFQSELCCEWDLRQFVHSLCISVTLWDPSISVRGGTASQSKPTVLSLNICSLLSEMRKSLSFPSMWRLKWRACLKTDCAKLGVYLNSMSTLLTWKYILNW